MGIAVDYNAKAVEQRLHRPTTHCMLVPVAVCIPGIIGFLSTAASPLICCNMAFLILIQARAHCAPMRVS
jgi:hypothetical protein